MQRKTILILIAAAAIFLALLACIGFSLYRYFKPGLPAEITSVPIAAATPSSPIPEPTQAQTIEPIPTSLPTLAVTATSLFQPLLDDPSQQLGLVVEVIDGDTIRVVIDNQAYEIQYIGVDAPELGAANPLKREQANEARIFNADMVLGKVVRLVKDMKEIDQQGRLLRYVFVGDLLVNYEMVRYGLARADEQPADSSYPAIFAEAEAIAKQEGLGVWAPGQKKPD